MRPISADAYDKLVRAWNRMSPKRRREAVAQCKEKGHDYRAWGDARVCVRCVKYNYD